MFLFSVFFLFLTPLSHSRCVTTVCSLPFLQNHLVMHWRTLALVAALASGGFAANYNERMGEITFLRSLRLHFNMSVEALHFLHVFFSRSQLETRHGPRPKPRPFVLFTPPLLSTHGSRSHSRCVVIAQRRVLWLQSEWRRGWLAHK